jgi:AbrB family looped-hinge helix DNA binding protein
MPHPLSRSPVCHELPTSVQAQISCQDNIVGAGKPDATLAAITGSNANERGSGMTKIRVNSRNQIVIPAEAREKLGIKPGDNLILDIGNHSILIIRETENHTEELRGLGKEVWADIDTDEWLQQERDSWDK